METVTEFILGGSKITADGECSHELKRHLLFWRKAMTNLESVSKSRGLLCWQSIVKAMVFPVVMYECESWSIKKAEHRRICFLTEVLEKTLESPLDCKDIILVNPKGNQSWIFIRRTDAEAETPILLATSCEELTHWKSPWCWERLRAGGEGDDRGCDGWMASLTLWTWVWVN